VLVRKPEGMKQLGRPGCRWVDNIKMNFQVIVWGVDWIDVTQNRDKWRTLVNMVMSLEVSFLEKPRDCYLLKKD
jgi:hypothetical protein